MDSTEHAPSAALVVEDDRAILELLDEVLQDAGFDTTLLTVGRPALDAIKERRFDLLVLDLWLPDLNGMQICEVAREHYQDDVTIVMISADPRQHLVATALQVCADDFMSKPFTVDELVARIEAKLRFTGR